MHNTAVVINPGLVIGKATFQNARILLHPSTRAASSMDRGTWWKNAFISQMAKGRLKVRQARMRPGMVLTSPARRNITNSGTITAAIGAILVERIQNDTSFLCRERQCAIPYPASDPRASAMKVEMIDTNRLLTRKEPTRLPPKNRLR